MMRLQLRLLGSPEVRLDGEPVSGFRSGKTQALLYYLALTGQQHMRPALAGLLWGAWPEKEARINLNQSLSNLRHLLGEHLRIDRHSVALHRSSVCWLDVEALDAEDVTLPQVIALLRGELLEGFCVHDAAEFEAWLRHERLRLRERALAVLHRLAEHHRAQGEWHSAIEATRYMLALEPWREETHRQLMLLLAHSGQRSAALAQYNLCCQALADELDIDPTDETTALYHAIRQGTDDPSPPSPTHPTVTPSHTTPFVGRAEELAQILQRLWDPACRLLTVMGPGGIGKTRLAAEATHRLADDFPDGVYWVDLQPAQNTEALISAIADALALTLAGRDDPTRQLLRSLRGKRLLLVLDNFEQLADSADVLSAVLQHCATIKLLVTSRVALHLQEEWLYPVSGLPYPSAEESGLAWADVEHFGAVQLFVEHVQRVRPDFSPAREQADLLRICRLVEGTPLALELAAAWARSLDCATIAAEIERNLTFLTSSLRNISQRHRSMSAVFAHSWALLSSAEQAVFPQLALFRGGFRREAAEAVTGATLPLLTSLVDQSLLRWQANGRYQMHELLRQYALNHMEHAAQPADQIHRRHAAYYLEFLHQRQAAILGRGQAQAADAIAAEWENIRMAWHWAVQHSQVEAIGDAIEALAMFCHMKGRYLDAARLYEAAQQGLPADVPAHRQVHALILSELGWVAIRLGQFERATHLFDACCALYRDLDLPPLPGQGTDPLLGLSTLASIRGDYAQAETLAQQACQTATRHHHVHNLQTAYYQLASIAYAGGNYAQAQQYAQAAYAACQQTGDEWFKAYCLNEMGRAALALGDDAAAQRHFEASYEGRRLFADPEGMALASRNLGEVALRQQQWTAAHDHFAHSVALYGKVDDKGGLAAAHNGAARVAVARGDVEAARAAFRQALTLAAEIHFTPLLLVILADVGQFLLTTAQTETGLALLALAQQQAAADQETKRLVDQQLRQAQTTLSPARLAAAVPPPDLATAVLVAQTALTIPPQPRAASHPATAQPLVEPLSAREMEVLQLLAQGLTNREIADRLTVVVGTVKAHNNSIFGKLGVTNRTQAAARARALKLL